MPLNPLRSSRRALVGGASILAIGALSIDRPVAKAQRNRGLLDLLVVLEQAQIALYEAILDRFDAAAFASDLASEAARPMIEAILESERAHLAALGGPVAASPPAVDQSKLATVHQSLEEAAALENLATAAYAGVIPEIRRRRRLRELIGIHSVEARQAAQLAILIGADPMPNAIDRELTPEEVLARLRGESQAESAEGSATPVPDTIAPLVEAIAAQLGVGPDDLQVVSVEPRDWPNSALGCPQPDMVYSEVITPGFAIVVEVGGEQIEFHTDGRDAVVRCP